MLDNCFNCGVAVYVFLEREGRIFTMRRAGTSFMNGFYCMPAGRVDANEDFITAAIRETKEEAGVTIAAQDLELVHTAHRKENASAEQFWIDVFFRCQKWVGEPYLAEPHKSDDLRWTAIAETNFGSANKRDLYFEQIHKNILTGQKFSTFGWNGETRIVPLSEAA